MEIIIIFSASTAFQPNQVPTAPNRSGVIIGNTDRQNEEVRQRRPQEQAAGPFQPPGAEG